MSIEAKQATPHNTLIGELMDSRIPKTEREHAAAREIERLRQAIEQAEHVHAVNTSQERVDEMAKGEHEPVAFECPRCGHCCRLEWVGLTDEDMEALFLNKDEVRLARYIEAKLKAKNA